MSDELDVNNMDERDRERVELYALTVGEVWRESRVSCPHRDILRAFVEGGLSGSQADYLDFHVNEAQCPYCQAHLADFDREDEATQAEELESLRSRLLSSTITFLRRKRERE